MAKKNKTDDYVTKTMLDEAVGAILNGIDLLVGDLRSEVKNDIRNFRDENTADHLEIKRKIDDLSADSPTIKQHLVLNEKVDHHINHHHLASSQ